MRRRFVLADLVLGLIRVMLICHSSSPWHCRRVHIRRTSTLQSVDLDLVLQFQRACMHLKWHRVPREKDHMLK